MREHVRHIDWAGPHSITTAIVETVAEIEGREPVNLSVIHDVVDPDALNRLFAPIDEADDHRSAGQIMFPYEGYRITVTADGTISIAASETDTAGQTQPVD